MANKAGSRKSCCGAGDTAAKGAVINREEGEGSKSEKLAAALEASQPIIIVTIQTFPFVLRAIENSVSLKERCYAIIADEAHSSQSGRTAGKLKEVLTKEESGEEEEIDYEDKLNARVEARKGSPNLSYSAVLTPTAFNIIAPLYRTLVLSCSRNHALCCRVFAETRIERTKSLQNTVMPPSCGGTSARARRDLVLNRVRQLFQTCLSLQQRHAST